MIENFNDYVKRAHETACAHGFHDERFSSAHCLMLVITEISEMVEADRKNRHAAYSAIDYCDKHPEDVDEKSWATYFERDVKNTVEDEMADVCIRIFDICGEFNIDMLRPKHDDKTLLSAWKLDFGEYSFAERAFSMCVMITDTTEEPSNIVSALLHFIYSWAHDMGINLDWHIEQKMRYNKTRSNKHGKKY